MLGCILDRLGFGFMLFFSHALDEPGHILSVFPLMRRGNSRSFTAKGVMFAYTVFYFFAICFTVTTSQYKTLLYNGHNYTYARDELGDHADAVKWCRMLGGTLPSVHNQQDISFLSDRLVGRHRVAGPIALGAGKVKGPSGNYTWQWDDGTPVDYLPKDVEFSDCEPKCCGLILWPKPLGNPHDVIWTAEICETDFPRRKVCKLRPGQAVVDHKVDFASSTAASQINLTDTGEVARLARQHRQLMQALAILSEKIDLLSEFLPDMVDNTVRTSGSPTGSNSGMDGTALSRLKAVNKRFALLVMSLFLLCVGYAIFKIVPRVMGIKKKRRDDEGRGDPIRHRRLV